MNIALITPPTVEPVTLAEVKEYLRVTHTHEDATIARMAKASRIQCENLTRRSFLTQTRRLELTVPRFRSQVFDLGGVVYDPDEMVRGVRLPMRDVASIAEVKGIEVDGSLKSIANELIVFDEASAAVRWTPDFWTAIRGCSAIRIDYSAGGTTDQFNAKYADLVDALLMLTDFKYTHRSGDQQIPQEIRQVLQSHWTSATYSLP